MYVDYKSLTNLINGCIQDFYSFAYSLISDELLAQQLVIDAITAYLLEYKKDISVVFDSSFEMSADLDFNVELKNKVFRALYKIGEKRDAHFSNVTVEIDFQNSDRYELFYSMNIEERALLHLRMHTELEIDKICEIVGSSKTAVLQKMTNIRSLLDENIREV